MAIRVGWDKFEIALLVDACNRVLDGKIAKTSIVCELSTSLRKRAKEHGVTIDEIFRNENGISLQMTKMAYLLTDGKVGLPGASKAHADIANLSKVDPAGFAKLLAEAEKQIGIKETEANMSTKEKFSQWLSANPSKKLRSETIINALEDASNYCLTHNICKESFWRITEKSKFTTAVTKLLGMRIYRLTHRNTAMVLDKAAQLYKEFLKQLSSDEIKLTLPSAFTSVQLESERTRAYEKVYSISKVYDDPTGLSVDKMIAMLGDGADENIVREILDNASWATKLSEDVYSFSKRTTSAKKTVVPPPAMKILGCVTDKMFFKYLSEQVGMAEASCRSYVSAIRAAEAFARDNHYIPCKLYDSSPTDAVELMQKLMNDEKFQEYNRNQHNRLRAALTKLGEMVGQPLFRWGKPASAQIVQSKTQMEDFDKEKFEETLLRRYRNGMQFDSIDFENFREMYDILFDEELTFDDAALEERLRCCGVVYMDRLFPAEGIVDSVTKEKLFSYIDSSFASGKKVLYYKAIFEDLADAFASCFTLSDGKMLKAYIEYSAEREKYFFSPEYMSIDKHVTIDHDAEVEGFFLNAGKPMLIDNVCATLSHIPQEQVRRIITTDSHLLRNAKGEYFHVDIFEVSGEELEQVADIINGFISENEYAIWTDVWNEIQEKMPIFLENNLYLSWLGVRNAIEPHYAGKYSFQGAVISLPKDSFAMRDVYQLYAKHHEAFSADDIYNLSKELDTVIYFDALSEISVRVSSTLFVSKKQIVFDVDAIDKVIGSFMAKDYIRIREIDSFLVFPNVGYEWNEYLLESFVASYSKKYALLSNGYSLNNVAGAIVKKEGKIKEFADVCAAELADSGITLKKTEALNHLADVSLITRRSYRDLDTAIRKASQIRGRKE